MDLFSIVWIIAFTFVVIFGLYWSFSPLRDKGKNQKNNC